jgi:methylmalonyl-CoA mutase
MGLPGQAPFARGASAARPADKAWAIMPEHRHPLPAVANRAIVADLEHGAHGVVIRLSPKHLGEASVSGGCGCGGGVLVDNLEDWRQLLAGVKLAETPLSIAAGAAFLPAAAQLFAYYGECGIAPQQVRVQLGADPLGTLAARGTLARSAQALLAELGVLAQFTATRYPEARAVTVSTMAYDNAGASAVQELAAALSTAVTYLRAMEDAGLSAPQAARQLKFSLSVGVDQFLEIAKFRAMRLLWNRVLEVANVPESERSMLLHARTSRRILTQRDPWVNLLRTTIGGFGAAVGGVDQLTILPFDDVIGPHDEAAQRLSRNTQIILQEEAHLGRVLDASGGSYYVEQLTQSLAESAWKQFQDIERRGGMLAVLKDGTWAKEIDGVWQNRAKSFARRKTPITGISEFPHLGEKPVERTKVDTQAFESALLKRREQLAASAQVRDAVAAVAQASATDRPAKLIAAAQLGATLHSLQAALGTEPEQVTPFHLHRFAAAFEQLRDRSDEVLKQRGQRPRIFSANMGPVATHTARAMFSQNFFEAGGVEVLGNDGFADVASAVAAFKASGAKLVIICSSDAWYETSAAELGSALKQAGASRVILAGNPGANEAKYKEAGIDQFIFIGCDVLGTLTELADFSSDQQKQNPQKQVVS